MIDCSHANSQKQHERQVDVARDVAAQIAGGDERIFGVMIESHLNPGRQDLVPGQPLQYGVSITDACIGWDATVEVLRDAGRSGARAAREARRRRVAPTIAARDPAQRTPRATLVPTEIELKLALDAGRDAALLRHPALKRCARPRATARLISTYYDTPRLRCSRAPASRCACAATARRWVQTIKGPPPTPRGAACARAPNSSGR